MDVREKQKVQLKIFEEFDSICQKHGVEYFMAQGSLLGAVRYKGFIPWDDDIDVLMDYREIEKLMPIFKKEASAELLLTNHGVEPHYPLTWSKIRNTNTVSMPKRYEKIPINWGFCIDLFPMYPVSNNKLIRNIEVFVFKVGRKILLSEYAACEENPSLFTKFFAVFPAAFRRFCANCGTVMFKMHKKETEHLYITCRGGHVIKRATVYAEKKTLAFENGDYPVPGDYHKYLTDMYGDYMTPPPEEEQKGHELTLGEIVWKY